MREYSHAHDLVAAVDVKYLSGDGRSAVAGQKNPVAPFPPDHVPLFRANAPRNVQHHHETEMPPAASVLHRPGGDTIDANFLRAQIVGKIAGGSFQ